jgi:hypothetical protein
MRTARPGTITLLQRTLGTGALVQAKPSSAMRAMRLVGRIGVDTRRHLGLRAFRHVRGRLDPWEHTQGIAWPVESFLLRESRAPKAGSPFSSVIGSERVNRFRTRVADRGSQGDQGQRASGAGRTWPG